MLDIRNTEVVSDQTLNSKFQIKYYPSFSNDHDAKRVFETRNLVKVLKYKIIVKKLHRSDVAF